MKTKTSRNILLFLLSLLGLGAAFGGGTLIISPSGKILGMPLSMLENSPFNNFLIPGIILFSILGLAPVGVTLAMIKKPEFKFAEHFNFFRDMHLNIAIYAPTHNFNLRTIIIDDDHIINLIDSLIYKFSINIYKWLYKPRIIQLLIKIIAPDREFEYLKAKPKLENVQKRNSGFKTKPAAIIMIIGDKKVPLTLESAQYALYNIDLYAQSKGIACRNLVGNQMILNGNKKFKKLIGLDKNEKIFGTITMGYSTIKFKNKVFGKHIKIQWNTVKN
jgi:hypothetical protein